MALRAPDVPPSFFFNLAPGNDAPSHEAASAVLDGLESAVRAYPHWVIETAGNGAVSLRVRSYAYGEHLGLSLALDGVEAELMLRVDTSLWVEIVGTHNGIEIFRAYLDRPYEEFEFWPAGADVSSPRDAEAPGRIGKRKNWINLLVAGWPGLVAYANEHGIVAACDDDTHLHNPAHSLE